MISSLLAKYPVQDHNTAQAFFDDMVKLFDIMLDKTDLYIATLSGPVFWSTVISQSGSGDPMAAVEAANLVACYIEARSAYSPPDGNKVTNALTELVDQWMEVEAEHRSLSLPGVFQVAVKTGTSDAGNTPQGTLQGTLQKFNSLAIGPKVWPPVHFGLAEKAVMLSSRIRPLVEGRSIETPGGFLPLPTKTSMPAAVTAFLTSFALENHHPGQLWRMGLTSMGLFQRPAEKARWAAATDGQTNLMWTPSGFARFVNAAFEDPSVHLALGLLTP